MKVCVGLYADFDERSCLFFFILSFALFESVLHQGGF
jgi:hypothetical protein